jgi:hypothetical protein
MTRPRGRRTRVDMFFECTAYCYAHTYYNARGVFTTRRLLSNPAHLRFSSDSLLRVGLRPLLALRDGKRMLQRALAWLIPARFLPSAPRKQLDGTPPDKRSSTISVDLSTLPRVLFRRRSDTLPMHIGDSGSPSSTLSSPTPFPGQKRTVDDLGYSYAENSEMERDGIFARPTPSSPCQKQPD